MTEPHISKGIQPDERAQVAALYWQAFGQKLGKVMGPDHKALAFIEQTLDPEHAIVARSDQGDLLGVAGFKTSKGALVDGGFSDLVRAYGLLASLWRAPLLALLERDLAPDCLLMDGIFVSTQARGQGVGTKLLHQIVAEASARGLARVRLDVIDSNPRARQLYERFGFVEEGQEHLGLLRHVFGFSSSTRMTFGVSGT